MNSRDTSAEARQVQVEIYRRMSPARKFELIRGAYEFGRALAMAGIRMRYPNATSGQVRQIWLKEHLGEQLYSRIYGDKGDGGQGTNESD
ncbi:MAG: hypothetical protein JSU94_05165 [Phycisphaerales bacterium]|nr:MAG: hypothetical protein JSU94_05165 [Phycisphaerales bacterium]